MEPVSFASPKHVPQMAGAEEICAALTERSFAAIGLVLNGRGLERALSCDLDEINVVAYAADGYARKNTGAGAEERNAEAIEFVAQAREAGRRASVTIAVAFGDPVDGPVAPKRGVAAGAGEIALGDTIGVANPVTVEHLVPAVAAAAPSATVRCHFHNTRNA